VPSGPLLKQSDGDGDAIGLLVATALPARDHATIVPFDPGCHRAAVLPWADGDATRADADRNVRVMPPTVPVVAIPPNLNVDALGHL